MRLHIEPRVVLNQCWKGLLSGGIVCLISASTGFARQNKESVSSQAEGLTSSNRVGVRSDKPTTGVKLSGVVKLENGDPAAEVDIRVVSPTPAENVVAKTGVDGRFLLELEIPRFQAGRVVLRAVSSQGALLGFGAPASDSKLYSEGVGTTDIVLHSSREIEVKVYDDIQNPAANTNVIFSMKNVELGPYATNERGVVRVTLPVTGESWWVLAAKDESGIGYRRLPTVFPDEPIPSYDLVLAKSQPLRVQLRGLEQEPVIGAQLACYHFRNDSAQVPFSSSSFRGLLSTQTDDMGEAWLDVLPQGTAQLSFSHPDYETYSLTVHHRRGAEFVHQVSLRNVVTNRCRVLDPTGKPFIDQDLEVKIVSSPVRHSQSFVRTNHEGIIEFPAVVEKPYLIAASADGLGAEAVTGIGVMDQEESDIQELRLMPLTTVSGQVRSEDSDLPLAGRTVYLSQLGKGLGEISGMKGADKIAVWQRQRLVQSCITDADGRYQFSLPRGEFNLSLEKSGDNTFRFSVGSAATQTIDIMAKATE